VSQLCHVISEVPQGSVRRPFLFLIYINDVLNCDGFPNVLPFAFLDDVISSATIHDTSDCLIVQKYLDFISKWSKDWLLSLAPNKCVSFCTQKYPIVYKYKVENFFVRRSNTVTDLGIVFNANLNFSSHVFNVS